MKHIIFRLLLVFVSIAISIIITEQILKLRFKDIQIQEGKYLDSQERLVDLGFWTSKESYQEDPELIYSFKNSLQFPSKNLSNKSNNNHLPLVKIFLIGDSFTYGAGITNKSLTYPNQLQKILDLSQFVKRVNVKTKVYNLGVPGYSPDQEYRLILNKVINYNPSIVIWNIVDVNDLYDSTFSTTWPVPALYTIKNNTLLALDARLNWMYISNFIRLRTPRWFSQSLIFNLFVKQASQVYLFNRKPHFNSLIEFKKWGLDKLKTQILDINKIAKKKNFQLFITILPTKDSYGLIKQPEWILNSKEELVTELKAQNITVIDIKEEVDKNYDKLLVNIEKNEKNILGLSTPFEPKDIFFKNDFHPNETGAFLFSSIVAEKISKSMKD